MINKLNINESFISRIWEGHALYYSALKTTDNEPVEILSIGNRNYDSGPDYSNAKIKIGEKTFTGDVEIHRDFTNWEEHNHQKDRKYNSVILQIVMWDSPDRNKPKLRLKRNLPTVILSKFLNSSIHDIWQDIINNPSSKFKLACHDRNNNVPDNDVIKMFNKLSIERIKVKSGRIKTRLREIDFEQRGHTSGEYLRTSAIWKQVLYEFVFEALGYSKNKEPMMKLASSLKLKTLNKFINLTARYERSDGYMVHALLFGVGGFFFDLRHKDNYINELKKIWNNISPKLKTERLNKTEWNFFRLRPRNFPTIRIAYGSQLIMKILTEDLLKKIILSFDSKEFKVKSAHRELTALFVPENDIYWQAHYNFGKPSKSSFKLLGMERINDIIINVVIPLAYLYSSVFKKETMKSNVLLFYNSLKIKPVNSVLKVIESQVLPAHSIQINSPAMEQASLQLYNFYCTRERCLECDIGKQVFKDKGYEYKIIFY